MKIKKKILLIVGKTIVSPVYYIDKKMIYSSYIIWMCMIDILVLVPKIVLINDNVARAFTGSLDLLYKSV